MYGSFGSYISIALSLGWIINNIDGKNYSDRRSKSTNPEGLWKVDRK